MKLTQSERVALGIGRSDNSVPMTNVELSNIRKTLNLSQEGLGALLGVSRYWVMRCEKGKEESHKMSYAHAFILRLLMDMNEEQRQKWITVPQRSKKGLSFYQHEEQKRAAYEDAQFEKNGYEVE